MYFDYLNILQSSISLHRIPYVRIVMTVSSLQLKKNIFIDKVKEIELSRQVLFITYSLTYALWKSKIFNQT